MKSFFKPVLKLTVVLVFVLGVAALYKWNVFAKFSIAALGEMVRDASQRLAERPLESAAEFTAISTALVALCIPGSIIVVMLAGGALFGLIWGSFLILISATLGSALAFLAARFVFRDFLERTFEKHFLWLNKGLHESARHYVLILRLVHVLPFVLINIGLGLSRLPFWTFVWCTFVGIVPATVLYANAGRQLSEISSAGELLSPNIVVSFLLLALFAAVPIYYNHRRRKK